MRCFLLLPALMGSLFASGQNIESAKQLLYHERYESAAEQLHKLLQADPSNAEGWYLLGQVYLDQKNNLAKDSLLKAPAAVKEKPFFQAAYGHVLLRENKKDSAALLFQKALKSTKYKNSEILAAVADAQIKETQGDTTLALELLKRAIKRNEKDASLLVMLGDLYRKMGNGSKAYQTYNLALQKDDQNAAAYYKMGKIFTSQQNSDIYLKNFNQALAADSLYAPALYELYYYYYFRDVNKAMDYLQQYIAASDANKEHDYMITDLLYVSRKYEEAIHNAQRLIEQQENEPTRLYKLISYSYKELKDTAKAYAYMLKYINKTPDSAYLVKDFENMADIYASMEGKEDSAIHFYERAIKRASDTTNTGKYYQKIADLYKKQKDYANEAKWLKQYYQKDSAASNLVLFNWGLANYMAKDYPLADSVFGLYTSKYPDQRFGYYWRARSSAAIDTAMEQGLAIPHYLKVIELAEKDTTDEINRKRLVEAYGYLATYKANMQKDFATAVNYFEKILFFQPENASVKKYIDLLKSRQPDKNNVP